VDLVFCNKDEALAFTGSDDLDSAIQKLKLVTKSFAITDGAKGAITFDGDSVFRSEGVSAKAIDTNGAGDMFAGGFLYAITSGKGYEWAAKLANDCASRVVAKFGPRLEPEEFCEIKAKFGI
jgi:sugar/nucleoside kinase (ribokinase family)